MRGSRAAAQRAVVRQVARMPTEAEGIFEQFCAGRGLQLLRIQEGAEPTPDYELHLANDVTVAVEVKEFEPSEEDLAVIRELQEGRVISRYAGGGTHARQRIRDAMRQLRPHAKGRMPALLVLYDKLTFYSLRLDPDAIRFALYGPERVHVAVPRDPNVEPVVLGASYGGGRAVDPTQNTTLSAVATLNRPSHPQHAYSLFVFHNIHAARPLHPDTLRAPDITHFTLAADSPEHLPRWREV